ncbi:MAG: 5'/3'-nucleotidase SurE [Acidimicrobiales bacterium]
MKRRVLVTNDDGIHAPGLAVLASAVAGHPMFDVVVAGPLDDRSGSGASIGPVHRGDTIRIERASLARLPGVAVFGVDGPPALAVLAARLGGFGPPPELVVSGVNPGNNTGRAVLHSGTVGAALTAANFGVSGLAVSLAVGNPPCWDTAAAVSAAAAEWLVGAPRSTVLNVNVPNLALGELRGVCWASLARFGTVRAALVEVSDGVLQVELRDNEERVDPESDTAKVGAGWVTLTALSGLRAVGAEEPELTRAPHAIGGLLGAGRGPARRTPSSLEWVG